MEDMEAQEAIDKAREIMESFDDSGAMTLGFDESHYTLSKEQMLTIASALYLADCKLHELQTIKSNQC